MNARSVRRRAPLACAFQWFAQLSSALAAPLLTSIFSKVSAICLTLCASAITPAVFGPYQSNTTVGSTSFAVSGAYSCGEAGLSAAVKTTGLCIR